MTNAQNAIAFALLARGVRAAGVRQGKQEAASMGVTLTLFFTAVLVVGGVLAFNKLRDVNAQHAQDLRDQAELNKRMADQWPVTSPVGSSRALIDLAKVVS